MTSIAGKEPSIQEAKLPLIRELVAYQEAVWFNPGIRSGKATLTGLGLTVADIDDAAARLRCLAPYITQVFPETRLSAGIIESPLYATPFMQAVIEHREDIRIPGELWVETDAELPVSGSIKARGEICKMLHHAEWAALGTGLITRDSDYRELDSPGAHELFAEHSIAVGSTGNLGLSIGIMSARFGFNITMHMSTDARPWEKEMLHRRDVEVVEYEPDYSVAVAASRKQARSDPSVYFVDNENSTTLLLSYTVAGRRLAGRLQIFDIPVDEKHPLFVYLPRGVGGGPDGITFGLKTVFGDAVHPVFAEPAHSPSMLLGVRAGLHDEVYVQNSGIDNVTAVDRLAVGRPSGFVGRSLGHTVNDYYTVSDENLYRYLTLLRGTERLKVEPSTVAGFLGPQRVLNDAAYLKRTKLISKVPANTTHLIWTTGGSMVPLDEMSDYFHRGVELLPEFRGGRREVTRPPGPLRFPGDLARIGLIFR